MLWASGDVYPGFQSEDGSNRLCASSFVRYDTQIFYKMEFTTKTRMHSSRMRTGFSLIVCRSLLPGACLLPGGVCSQGGVVSQHALMQTPPVNRITDTSKNITLATTSLRPVKTRSQILHSNRQQ